MLKQKEFKLVLIASSTCIVSLPIGALASTQVTKSRCNLTDVHSGQLEGRDTSPVRKPQT